MWNSSDVQRYKLTIEYCGTNYVGWQHQEGLPSVQRTIEDALFKLGSRDIRPTLYAAGRTDSGVHARGQVAHVDLVTRLHSFHLQQALNFYLKNSNISILAVEEVLSDFHARFSAKRRTYCYRIINRRSPLSIDQHQAWQIYQEIDIQAFKAGAACFLGHHDFTSFRSSACQSKSPIKTLENFDVEAQGDTILCHITARSFLHHQVRNMLGTLKYVGIKKWAPEKVSELLALKDRQAAGPTAPPYGLYLMSVKY